MAREPAGPTSMLRIGALPGSMRSPRADVHRGARRRSGTTKRETARRVKQRISAICRWAVAQGHRTDDPAGVAIDAALPRNGVKRRHMPALPYEDVAECIAKVRGSARASESSKLALEFLVLTAARSGEVRKATWDEIDLDGATWTVPAERMKANREHRVPLSKRALEVLAEAAELADESGLVFPGMRPGRPLSENTHAKLLRELGFEAVTHGFRSSFRDYAAERTHTPACGHGGGARACGQEQGRGRLRAERSVREATCPDGILVGLPRRLIARPSVGPGSPPR